MRSGAHSWVPVRTPARRFGTVYNIAGDRLIYSDTTDPEHRMFSAVNINGGPKEQLAPLPHGQFNFTFGVDPLVRPAW